MRALSGAGFQPLGAPPDCSLVSICEYKTLLLIRKQQHNCQSLARDFLNGYPFRVYDAYLIPADHTLH